MQNKTEQTKSTACLYCYNIGKLTRWVPTRKKEGYVYLRYSPKDKFCQYCKRTMHNDIRDL